jgi:hypothetical protein
MSGAYNGDGQLENMGRASTSVATEARTTDWAAVIPGAGTRYLGFSVRESAATADWAEIIIHNGDDDADVRLEHIILKPDESAGDWKWPGIESAAGIFVEIVSGEVDVVIYYEIVTAGFL